MSILKDFDLAIAHSENTPTGYVTNRSIYHNYMSNTAWEAHLSAMSTQHRNEYSGGSGGELVEKNGHPPKMAAFASSSRMVYLLSNENPGFSFEKPLSTVIGGVANLDGYLKNANQYVFVEAKCREPYNHKSPQTIKQNYQPLYAFLQRNLPDMFSCIMGELPNSNHMRVSFFCCGKEVVYFDIKQMLCHLLGIANRMLLDEVYETPIQFLYLLYNPSQLALPQESREEILRIYHDTCQTTKNYDFQKIFACIVDFLLKEKSYTITQEKVERLKQNFHFALCDQFNYRYYFK